MGYVVIHSFTDLQDANHLYRVGDLFPRQGISVSDKRLTELSGNENKQGKPLIEKQKEKNFLDEFADSEKILYTKTEINRMPNAELKRLARENNIDDGLNGGEIKKALIKKFNL